MYCNKSERFLSLWEKDSVGLKRKLTEFSLQLTPTKFSEMINYKKILMENLQPEDFEFEVYSDGKEAYLPLVDSKIKSLCLKKAKLQIEALEESQKNPDDAKNQKALDQLQVFVDQLTVNNYAYGTEIVIKDIENISKICINDTEIVGIDHLHNTNFDLLTFNEGYRHTFTFRLELKNGDMYSFYSAIGRDGVKGEKPNVFASAFVDGYYISKKMTHTIY